MRSARCSGWRRSRSIEVGAADDDARLRAAEQLVAAEADEVGAGRERSARGRLVGEVERARPSRDRRAAAASCRCATAASSCSVGCSVKPTTRKFDWCTRSSSAVSGADRALVVGGARAVRRADLDEPRAGAGEHVGDAEAVADLDQLAARDEHLAALGERGEREQHRAGVVVDDDRRLGAGQPAQDAPRRDPGASRASPSSRSYSRFE